jgi:hypothetical protein
MLSRIWRKAFVAFLSVLSLERLTKTTKRFHSEQPVPPGSIPTAAIQCYRRGNLLSDDGSGPSPSSLNLTPLALIQLRLMRLKPLIIQLNWRAALFKCFKVREGDRKRMSRDDMFDIASALHMQMGIWKAQAGWYMTDYRIRVFLMSSRNSVLLWSPHAPNSVSKSPPIDPFLMKINPVHNFPITILYGFLIFVLQVYPINFSIFLTDRYHGTECSSNI